MFSWYLTNIYSERFFDVQDHTTHSDHDYLEYRGVISLEFSDDLPAEVESDFENSVPSVTDPDNQVAGDNAMEDKKVIREQAIKAIRLANVTSHDVMRTNNQ